MTSSSDRSKLEKNIEIAEINLNKTLVEYQKAVTTLNDARRELSAHVDTRATDDKEAQNEN